MQAIELATGEVRWSAQDVGDAVEKATGGASLFATTTVVGGSGGSAVVLGTTYRSPCPDGKKDLCHVSETSTTAEFGVVGLSAADGSVAWLQVVVPSIERRTMATADDDHAVVVAADTEAVVVATGSSLVINGSYTADEQHPCRTVVLDAATGRERWRVDDLLPLALAGDVVMTMRPTGTPGTLRDPFSEVTALDVRTGRRRWSSADALQPAALGASSPGIVVLAVGDKRGNRGGRHLLDPSTGEELTDPLPISAGEVILGETASGQPLAAWTLTEDRGPVYTMALPDAVQGRSAKSPHENTSLIGGWIQRGYLWCNELGASRTKAIDRSGNDCSDTVPGFLVEAADDSHLVMLHRGVRGGGSTQGFTVYAIEQ